MRLIACQEVQLHDLEIQVEYTSLSTSDNQTKDPSIVPIIKPTSVSSENTTNFPSPVPMLLPSSKPSNILIECISVDPTGVHRTMTTYKPS